MKNWVVTFSNKIILPRLHSCPLNSEAPDFSSTFFNPSLRGAPGYPDSSLNSREGRSYIFEAAMNKLLHQFFTNDHRRLEAFLKSATEDNGDVQIEHYNAFRTGLLKHIKMEEKILFPAAQKANDGVPLPLAAKLRLDHAAITSLLVLPPDASLIKVLWYILDRHDLAEEEPGGMYDVCASLTEGETQALLYQL